MQRHAKTTTILAALAAVVLTLQTAGTAKTVADAIARSKPR
jgi:hypothetical protein